MKVLNIAVLFISVLTSSCQTVFFDNTESGYQVVNDFAKEVKSTDNLNLIGFGGGSFKGLSYNLTFSSTETPSLDEARAMFYNTATKFFDKINANEKLRAKVESNVFTIENLGLKIFFQEVDGTIVGVGNGFLMLRNQFQYVYFSTYDLKTREPRITYEESFEEMKRIVESQGLNTCHKRVF